MSPAGSQAGAALATTLQPVLAKVQDLLSRVLDQKTLSNFSWKSRKSFLVALVGYLALVRSLRYRRESALRRKYGYHDRASLSRMTTDEAQQILRTLAGLEFPLIHLLSLEFGLFKTYGIETIAKMLSYTGNLTNPKDSLKRYEDTATIINEFTVNAPGSQRANQAIARMNYLHAKYRANGKISEDDLLYTLSVFVTEPPRFTSRYDWRPMNEMEVCASGVFWKSIGDAMQIEYKGRLSKAETGWKDGLEFWQDISEWANRYEVDNMKPNDISTGPARALIPMITYWMPSFMQPFAKECVHTLIHDRIREAFKIPEPRIETTTLMNGLLSARRFVIKYLMLPRIFELKRLNSEPDENGRYQLPFPHGNFPFYIKPTLWNRWGPIAWATWLYGGTLPGDNPVEFMPTGYTFNDLGPVSRMNLGKKEMEEDVESLMRRRRGGCPF